MSERPPTSHDVARLAGVSQPTVSRALRDAAGVSTATKRAVRDAADELDSIPSHRGRSLSTRRAGQIALVIGDLGSPFYLEILQAADAVLRDAGQRMLVMTPDAVDDALAPRLLDGSLDGTILTTGVALADGRTRRGPYSFAFGRETAPALLETGPTALFCADDVVALGAYNAMASRGVDVPRDVSLVGFDDISLASWEVFQLTTVRGDLVRLVQTATELLLERIALPPDAEQPPPRRVVVAPELMRRRTLAPLPAWRRVTSP